LEGEGNWDDTYWIIRYESFLAVSPFSPLFNRVVGPTTYPVKGGEAQTTTKDKKQKVLKMLQNV